MFDSFLQALAYVYRYPSETAAHLEAGRAAFRRGAALEACTADTDVEAWQTARICGWLNELADRTRLKR